MSANRTIASVLACALTLAACASAPSPPEDDIQRLTREFRRKVRVRDGVSVVRNGGRVPWITGCEPADDFRAMLIERFPDGEVYESATLTHVEKLEQQCCAEKGADNCPRGWGRFAMRRGTSNAYVQSKLKDHYLRWPYHLHGHLALWLKGGKHLRWPCERERDDRGVLGNCIDGRTTPEAFAERRDWLEDLGWYDDDEIDALHHKWKHMVRVLNAVTLSRIFRMPYITGCEPADDLRERLARSYPHFEVFARVRLQDIEELERTCCAEEGSGHCPRGWGRLELRPGTSAAYIKKKLAFWIDEQHMLPGHLKYDPRGWLEGGENLKVPCYLTESEVWIGPSDICIDGPTEIEAHHERAGLPPPPATR